MTLVLVPQFDGGPLAGLNCNCACGAMLVALETGGQKHPTGSEFRSHVRNDNNTPDVAGGTHPSQIVECAKRVYGVTLDQRVMPFEDAWKLGARTDVAVSMSISYAVISGTRFDASPGFTGFHQVVLSGGKVADPLADGRRPGIPTGPEPWPKDLLRRAAGKYSQAGVGRAAVILGYAPAVKPTRYSVKFEPGSIFLYRRSGSMWTRDQDTGVTKRTSAPCDAPVTVPWLSGRKRLVEITAGKYDGRYVEPTATHLALVAA